MSGDNLVRECTLRHYTGEIAHAVISNQILLGLRSNLPSSDIDGVVYLTVAD